jgi:hypothetical protein
MDYVNLHMLLFQLKHKNEKHKRSCETDMHNESDPVPNRKIDEDYVKTHFGNRHRLLLVTGKAPVNDHVLQMSQER